MELGQIYRWETDKAKGYEARYKYHLYICEPDWREDHTFLFISKANYNGDYPINNTDYPFMPLEVSYIGGCVFYTDAELNAANPQLVGTLLGADLKALYNSVASSRTMEGGTFCACATPLREASNATLYVLLRLLGSDV